MKQNYFIVVVAHSLHGRLRRVHIPHHVVYVVLGLAILGSFSVFGFVSSYARMVWKVANYNALRQEAEVLRQRYQNLQKVVNQTNEQLATLQMFASEVSIAYGIKQKLEGPADLTPEARLVPTFSESLEEYNYLRTTNVARSKGSFSRRWHINVRPSIWPVDGRLLGPYGHRVDPFSGEGAYHTGVDISAPSGTRVRTAADGIVIHARFSGGYGRLVIVDHGSGMQTYYAHLSRFGVIEGQEVRRGETIGAVGASGRVTAPHLHYEVRVGRAPVNPYTFLRAGYVSRSAKKDFPF
ncbi:MAG: peptidoglycan DD-metalloendopeptidase family protein [Bryobacteraceae bacterium]